MTSYSVVFYLFTRSVNYVTSSVEKHMSAVAHIVTWCDIASLSEWTVSGVELPGGCQVG